VRRISIPGEMDKGSSEAKSTSVLIVSRQEGIMGQMLGNNGTLRTLSRHSEDRLHFGVNVSFFSVFHTRYELSL
jgi:hypothetical protein